MAYGDTNLNYYDDTNIIKSSYAANISGQLSRIEDAHTAIKKKAIELGLKIPAGKRLTTNATGTSDLALANSHNILDTAAAINNIPINTDKAKTLSAGGSYTVPVGFNAVAYTVTAKTLSDQINCDPAAVPADVLYGKKFSTDGTVQTGTMADNSGAQTTSGYGPYTSNSTDYLYFKIPTTGKYTKDSQLQSTIPYYSSGSVEIPVTITVGSTGETIASTSQFFPQGYYSGGVKIKAVYEGTTTNKVINIATEIKELSYNPDVVNKLQIPDGYDYFARDTVYTIKTGSISAVTRSVDSSTGVVSFSGGTTTAGWIRSNVSLPATYTPTAAVFSTDATTGKVTVTTAGWVKTDKDITGLQAGSATMSGPKQNSDGDYYMELVKTAGYITKGTSTTILGTTSLSAAALTSAGSSATTITSKYFKVTASAGYNASTLTKNLTVQNAAYSTSSSTGKITVTTAGWIAANTVLGWGSATAQSYTMDGDDITASTFVVACATNTPMTQLTVNTDVILNRLKAI